MHNLILEVKNFKSFQELKALISKEKLKEIQGVPSSARGFILAILTQIFSSFVWITPSLESCKCIYDDLNFYLKNTQDNILIFPPKEEDYDNQRLRILEKLFSKTQVYIIAPIKAVLQPTFKEFSLKKEILKLKIGDIIKIENLILKLISLGYEKNYLIKKQGEYAKRGFIVDIFPAGAEPTRIEFLGDAIESIRLFDLETQLSKTLINTLTILPLNEREEAFLIDYLNKKDYIILEEPAYLKLHALEYLNELNKDIDFNLEDFSGDKKVINLTYQGELKENFFNFNILPLNSFSGKIELFIKALRDWQGKTKIFIISKQVQRLKEIFKNYNLKPVYFQEGIVKEGFKWLDFNLILISDYEIFGSIPRKHFSPKIKTNIVKVEELFPGEYIVHLQYGLAKFLKIAALEIEKNKGDFLVLEFANGIIYHPATFMEILQKYVAPSESKPHLSYLGGKEWEKIKSKIKDNVKEIAQKLLSLYSSRKILNGYQFSKDTAWQTELEMSFPFEETPDQLKAIQNVKEDMEANKPMERLICGDAGYGKTEVSLRAAFKTVMEHKQAALLVPTTVLAQQHYNTFKERLSAFPVKVEMLSRFRSAKEQKEIVLGLENGVVDIIIGTHRLLQKDIKFKDLGLLIIDEEQRFGVIHKEKLKEIKKNIDVLSLSATPIPRTFHMSLIGVRDLSIINTPPENRLPIKTYLLEYNEDVIKSAVKRELERDGQVFFLHNRVYNIDKIARMIKNLIPQANIGIAHGQMSESDLEEVMLNFIQKKYAILICTTIIESGIDIPNVNTIIINNAHQFGLADLYQLRGRVGRTYHQAYAYFLYPPKLILTQRAKKRLEILKEFSDLGSGFQIALKDLEIRGTGNLLGREQHGFINQVGLNLYSDLLKEAVKELKGEKKDEKIFTSIDLPAEAYFPSNYIEDDQVKLGLYLRIANFIDLSQIKLFEKELKDRFGTFPKEVKNLLKLLEIKILAQNLKILNIKQEKDKIILFFPFKQSLSLSSLKEIIFKEKLKIYFKNYQLFIENLIFKVNFLKVLKELLLILKEIN